MHLFHTPAKSANSGLQRPNVWAGRCTVSFEKERKLASLGIFGEPIMDTIRHCSKTLFVFDGPSLRDFEIAKHVSTYMEWGWKGRLSHYTAHPLRKKIGNAASELLEVASAFTHYEGYLVAYEKMKDMLENRHGHVDMAKRGWTLAFSGQQDETLERLRGKRIGNFSFHAHRYRSGSAGAERMVKDLMGKHCVDPGACLEGRLKRPITDYKLLLVELKFEISELIVKDVMARKVHRKPPWAHNESPNELAVWINIDPAELWPNTMNRNHQYKIHTLTVMPGMEKTFAASIELASPRHGFEMHERTR